MAVQKMPGRCPKKSSLDRPSSKNCSLNRDVDCPSVRTIFAHSSSERSAMAGRLQLPRVPNLTDQHVGSRVRMRRLMLAMGQGKLGARHGLTFQQAHETQESHKR